MDSFPFYLEIGLAHILDVAQGLDHVLFILALTAASHPREWKKLLVLVTAFTMGHSVTLAMATLDVVRVSVPLVEVLIVVTILVTAMTNFFTSDETRETPWTVNFWFAAVFGLIHGLGFSNMLRSLLMGADDIVVPLLAFNTGLEIGQLMVVLIFSGITFLVIDRLGLNRRHWKLVISGSIVGMALLILVDRINTLL